MRLISTKISLFFASGILASRFFGGGLNGGFLGRGHFCTFLGGSKGNLFSCQCAFFLGVVRVMEVALVSGEKMYVVGTGLKIIGFSKTNGTFNAEGVVSGVSYGGKSFAARLFR